MRTQAADLAAGRKAQSTDDLDAIEQSWSRPSRRRSLPRSATLSGGMRRRRTGGSLPGSGVDRVVSGGQTMNPSTEAILREVNHTPSEIVFVLPNNKNIVMAAQQCVGLTEKQVIVVPTTASLRHQRHDERGHGGGGSTGYSCGHDRGGRRCHHGQITYAARNSDFDGFAINEGDYLALCGGALFGTQRDIKALLQSLADKAKELDSEFITIFYGADITEEDAQVAEEIFHATCPDAEVTLLSGGQLYTIT